MHRPDIEQVQIFFIYAFVNFMINTIVEHHHNRKYLLQT